jgi:hypothetical protein
VARPLEPGTGRRADPQGRAGDGDGAHAAV